MALHIKYNDGSNPFFMLNVTREVVNRELAFQKKRNAHSIKSIFIVDEDFNTKYLVDEWAV